MSDTMPSPGEGNRGTLLLVANFRPDVGFAWWLIENFWVEFSKIARARELTPLLAYPLDGEVPESIRKAGIETVIMPFPGKGIAALLRSLRLLRRRRVRCVYFTDRDYTRFAYLLFRLAGVRVILNHDHTPGDRPPVGGLKGMLKAAWRRLPWMSCDQQICVSPLIQERATRNARIPQERSTVVQNGIPLLEGDCDSEYVRNTFGLAPETQVCVSVARAHPYKRIDFVIDVARRCTIDMGAENLCFLYCGDGPDMERLRSLAAEARLGNRFIFAGKRTDVKEILGSSHFAIHPAMGEAFSLAILEYMRAGLATLLPDVPTVCQAVRDGETGVVFRDGDAEGAAVRLMELYRDPTMRRRLGEAAAREVKERYSLEGMNARFREVAGTALSTAGYGPIAQVPAEKSDGPHPAGKAEFIGV